MAWGGAGAGAGGWGLAESAAVWAAQSGKDCWETILSIIVVAVAGSTHHPSAGNKVIEAAVDLLQFGNKHIHSTLSGFCEEILRMRGTKVISRCDWRRVAGGACALYRPCTGSSGRPVAVSQSRYGFGPGTSLGLVPPPPGLPAVSPSPAPALSFASAACEKKGVIEWGERKSHKLKETKAGLYISIKNTLHSTNISFSYFSQRHGETFRLVPG